MPILSRSTLGRYFETGKGLSNQAFVALIDSIANLQDTTAQEFLGPIISPSVVASAVSVGDAAAPNRFSASGVSFTGEISHGVSGQRGFAVVFQQATALASATTQVASLPTDSSILGLSVNAIRPSSAQGGCIVRFGNASQMIASAAISGAGIHYVTDVCARLLQGISGVVNFVAETATANSVFLPRVVYYSNSSLAANVASSAGSVASGYTVTFSASENNPDMVAKFVAAGWDGSSAFTGNIVINAGVIIGSTSTGSPAINLTSTSFPAGTTWNITNNGRIVGCGGAGGGFISSGQSGGTALKVNKTTTITNGSGEIWGGGGGGGAGGLGSGGESPGGGGGGGTVPGAGGTGGGGGGNGSAGTATAGGAGGAASGDSGTGGAGGAPGAIGSSGSGGASGTGQGGGAAGKYIEGISSVTFLSGSTSPNVKGGTS